MPTAADDDHTDAVSHPLGQLASDTRSGFEEDAIPAVSPRWLRRLDLIVLVALAIAAVGFRFVTRSPLWLDEALSVNIAKLPIGDIPGALRHDGHPPLYYVLLHGWMDVFGEGDVAVRALSGLFGVGLFPLAWIAGRRVGGPRAAAATLVVLAFSPYAVRYSTETRMYSLVMLLSLAAWLLADDALNDPTPPRLAGLALLTGALLWTHYWAMWFLGAAAIGLVVHLLRARRAGRRSAASASARVLGALVAGAVLFLPWVPSLLYQSARTGTPWAPVVRPTEMLSQSALDLGGGTKGEAVLLAFVLVVLVLLALFGRGVDGRHIELDLTTRPESRPALVVISGTFAIAAAAGYATGGAFATRYIAVLVPLVLISAAVGLSRFRGRVPFRLVASVVLLLGAAGGVRNVVTDRTQAGVAARAIRDGGSSRDLVITCPDQLGPALSRELPASADIVTYPAFAPPQRVDWVDYTERLAQADPSRFASEAMGRARGRTLWFVWSGSYRTHKGTCEKVLNGMLRSRPWATNVVVDSDDYFEHEAVWRLPARAGT